MLTTETFFRAMRNMLSYGLTQHRFGETSAPRSCSTKQPGPARGYIRTWNEDKGAYEYIFCKKRS